MKFSLTVGLFHSIVISSLILGAVKLFHHPDGDNECKMTYMWEYPEYAEIPLDPDIESSYPDYGLYFYGEGQYMEIMTQNFNLEGIPVLFIPGNAGSYKQGRSIGSVLLRKSQDVKWEPQFNVFTVNLNEELVGIYGSSLKLQVKYINHCIQKILSMYKESANTKPTSVVLVGHSMGGVVARGLFVDEDFDSKSVNTILSFASPHQAAVANLDFQINEFYEELNSYWLRNCEKLKHISVLSVSGGDNDYQVNSALTNLPVCSKDDYKISTISTHVPRVHVTASHQCSVWCNQLVLATARALFDMVDKSTTQISNVSSIRNKVLHHHFIQNPGYKAFAKRQQNSTLLLTKERTLVKNFEWSFDPAMSTNGYVSFDISFLLSQHRDFIVAKTDKNTGQWIFVSKETQLTPLPAVNVSDIAFKTPKFIVAELNLTKLCDEGYKLVLFNLKSRKQLMNVVAINKTKDAVEYEMPYTLSNIWTFGKGYKLTIDATSNQFYHEVTLVGFHSIFHAYSVVIEDKSTLKTEIIQFDIPWQSGSVYSVTNNISICLPFLGSDSSTSLLNPSLKIYTNKLEGELSLIIKPEFSVAVEQFLRYYGPMVLSMVVVNILFTFTSQVNTVLSNGEICSFGETHANCAKPYKVQPFTNVIKRLLLMPVLLHTWNSWDLPLPDFLILDNHLKIGFQFAVMCTFIIAYEIVKILNLIMSFLTRKFAATLLRKTFTFNTQLLFPIHVIAIAIIIQQNITFVFLYIFFMHFFKTSNQAAQCNGSSSSESEQQEKKRSLLGELEVNFTLLFMWLSLLFCTVPAILSAIQGHSPSNDHFNTMAYCAIGIFLLQSMKANLSIKSTNLKYLSWLFFPSIVLCSLFAFVSLYRLPHFILFFMFLHTVMQLL